MDIFNRKYKNSKFLYFLRNFSSYLLPDCLFRARLADYLSGLADYDEAYIMGRVNYYNKLDAVTDIGGDAVRVGDFRLRRKKFTPHSNFFDAYEYTRFFPADNRLLPLFGDAIPVPDRPSIMKSRPLAGDNKNSVLLNLDKVRLFMFVKDNRAFVDKKDMLVGRCAVYQPWRVKFWEMYFGHPLCDLGQVNKSREHKEWTVPKMPVDRHLEYKFILALEGNDIASNLRWVMSSNSLAVMPRPSYETWTMEGALIPDYHYVEIKKDYSDLPEKLRYYINNTGAALRILDNAHRYVAQFQDKRQERLISLLVLKKYFDFVRSGRT